jgi:hypothetical protein
VCRRCKNQACGGTMVVRRRLGQLCTAFLQHCRTVCGGVCVCVIRMTRSCRRPALASTCDRTVQGFGVFACCDVFACVPQQGAAPCSQRQHAAQQQDASICCHFVCLRCNSVVIIALFVYCACILSTTFVSHASTSVSLQKDCNTLFESDREAGWRKV